MNSPGVKSVFSRNPAWALSLITTGISLFLIFIYAGIFSGLGSLFGISDEWLGNFIAYLSTGITVAIICFFICKAHPKSIWYTPLISNIITLWSGLGNYITGSEFVNEALPFGIGFILSVIASIGGASLGKRV